MQLSSLKRMLLTKDLNCLVRKKSRRSRILLHEVAVVVGKYTSSRHKALNSWRRQERIGIDKADHNQREHLSAKVWKFQTKFSFLPIADLLQHDTDGFWHRRVVATIINTSIFDVYFELGYKHPIVAGYDWVHKLSTKTHSTVLVMLSSCVDKLCMNWPNRTMLITSFKRPSKYFCWIRSLAPRL